MHFFVILKHSIHDLYDDYIFNHTSGCYAFVCDFEIFVLTIHDLYDDYIFNHTSGCYAFVCDSNFLILCLFEVLLLVQTTILDSLTLRKKDLMLLIDLLVNSSMYSFKKI